MQELTCIVCPKGCRICADEQGNIKGAGCERGSIYAKNEISNPMRVVTSTVKLDGAELSRIPVKTSGAIPKKLVMTCMKRLNRVQITAPVKCGDVIVENILNTGVDLVATKTATRVEVDRLSGGLRG
ncbi:MAG: DUF1667 domain-containing protein [Christensenellaceae bacterium]